MKRIDNKKYNEVFIWDIFMEINDAINIINVIKKEPISISVIFSLLILPLVFLEWIYFFPESWRKYVVIIIIIIWVFALYGIRKELLRYRRKLVLLNYLKKEKRHSIDHLSNKWAGKNEFSKENINELLVTYPDVFKRTKVKSKGEHKDGIGLVEFSDKNDQFQNEK
ncbi:MAG: hypothetical protein D4S01_11655 [Dehalococcoidia bacterium]|nr:MAG: hypothetical protein D4S01_11620 [Dehalococcoidia bacterium]TRZ47799.1 MAG: hypothetical protein D4S01_11655 [Dehalococcoidia bacterium]